MKIKEVVKKALNLSGILEFVAKWLSSGPLGIILGLVGMGGFAASIFALAKKMKEAKYQNNIDTMNSEAGQLSQDLAENARNNTKTLDALLDAQLEAESEKPRVVSFSSPERAKKGVAFAVSHENVPFGTKIMADSTWLLGTVYSGNETKVVLNGVGTRVLSVEVEGIVYSSRTIIEE